MPAEDVQSEPLRAPRSLLWRLILLVLMLSGVIAYFALDLGRYLSLDELARHRDALLSWRDRHAGLAVFAFMSTYTLAVAVSVPGAIWFTIVGGFLFGIIPGTAYSVISATIGACAVFLAGRTLLGDLLRAKAGPAIRKMEAGFRDNALSYILVLRLVPIVPFWLTNLVPALLGVPLRTFFFGTAIGIVPASFIFALVGNGLGTVVEHGGTPGLDILFRPEILAPLLGLAVLALSPVFYRRLKRRATIADPRRERR